MEFLVPSDFKGNSALLLIFKGMNFIHGSNTVKAVLDLWVGASNDWSQWYKNLTPGIGLLSEIWSRWHPQTSQDRSFTD